MLKGYADKILVRDPDHIVESKGGIFLVGGARLDVIESTVISAGNLCKDPDLRPGARVVHAKLAGVKMEAFSTQGLPKGNYRVLRESELIAILSPEAVFEGGSGEYDANGQHDLSKD